MSFLPDSYKQGVTGIDNNGGFGTAAMFNKPTPQQQGNFGGFGDKISALIKALRSSPSQDAMPQSNAMPQMTPMQQQPIGPNMNQVNNPNMMSPNGQIMPNYNNMYGGFNGSNQ
jgi:hypothetical protein